MVSNGFPLFSIDHQPFWMILGPMVAFPRPALVELKNGDSYTGTLVAVDNFMNIRLEASGCLNVSQNNGEIPWIYR